MLTNASILKYKAIKNDEEISDSGSGGSRIASCLPGTDNEPKLVTYLPAALVTMRNVDFPKQTKRLSLGLTT